MSPEAFAYIAGGAGVETTMAANRRAFMRRGIVPRVLARRRRARPVGRALRPAAREPVPARADRRARARAPRRRPRRRARGRRRAASRWSSRARRPSRWSAAPRRWATRRAGSSCTGAPRTRSPRASSRRAEACGAEAIVLTVDTTMLGWRPRDLDLGSLPFVCGRGLAQYTSDPVFNALLDADPRPGAERRGDVEAPSRRSSSCRGATRVDPRRTCARAGRAGRRPRVPRRVRAARALLGAARGASQPHPAAGPR